MCLITSAQTVYIVKAVPSLLWLGARVNTKKRAVLVSTGTVFVYTCSFLLQTCPFLARAKQLPMMSIHPANLAFMSDIDLALCLFFTIKLSQAFWALLFHINDTSQKTPACSHFIFCLFCGPLSSKPFIPQGKYIRSLGNIL